MPASALGKIQPPVNALELSEGNFLNIESLPDEELLRRCARSDNAALEELVRRYQPRLTRLLSRLLDSPEDIEEALLSVFVRAWQYAPRFQYRARVSTWLYRIAVNIAHDTYKQRKEQTQQPLDERIERTFPQGNIETEALQR